MEGELCHPATSRRKRLRLPLSQNERDKDGGMDNGESMKQIDGQDDPTDGSLMTPARLYNKRRMFEIHGTTGKQSSDSHVILNSSLDSKDRESDHNNIEGHCVSDESLQCNLNGNNTQTEPERTSILISTPSFGNSSSDGDTELGMGKNACNFKLIMQSPSSRVSGIRIGENFQCNDFPVAGSYLTDTSYPIVEMDQVWDHQIASSKGCLDFLERDCPKQKLEVAIDMLSKNGYRHAGLLNKLQKLPPNDGSDWSQDERHKFHLLFDQFGHNLKKVARAMGKSVISCTLFHFGQGQKRQTRRSRTSSAIQQKSSKSIPPTETATIQQKPTKSIHTLDEPPETDEKDCKWNFYISELKKFKKEFGHTLVPKVFPQNQPLSSWVYKVRGYYRKFQKSHSKSSSYLTNDKIKELQDVGFSFTAKSTQEQAMVENNKRVLREESDWLKYYSLLCEFKNKHGHTIVPKRHSENAALAAWVFKQRHQYTLMKEGKMHRLNEDRVQKLNDIGFVWVAKSNEKWKQLEHDRIVSSYDDIWEKLYQELLKFKKKHGHTIVPKIYPQNQPLAAFVFCQRSQYRLREAGQTNTLTDARLAKLNSIDFVFSVKKSPKST